MQIMSKKSKPKPETAPQPAPKPASDALHPAIAAARAAVEKRLAESAALPPIVPKPAPSFAVKAAAKKTEPAPKAKSEPKSKAKAEPEVPLKPAVGSVETIEECVIPTRAEVEKFSEVTRAFIAAAKEFLGACNLIADKPWPCAAAIDQNACEQIDNIVTDDGQGLRYAIEDAETLLWLHDPAQTPAAWVKDLYTPKSKATHTMRRVSALSVQTNATTR